MFMFTRWTLLALLVAITGIFAGITAGIAQTPTRDLELPEGIDIPPVDRVDPTDEDDAPALKVIRSVMQGKRPPESTGDGVLDDILRLMPSRPVGTDDFEVEGHLGQTHLRCLHCESPLATNADPNGPEARSQRALAAELLLRASRTLEEIDAVDNTRQELVTQMRGEAAKLLSH